MTQGTNWKNVNNWHWVDKNCLPWAQTYFQDQLTGKSITHNEITVKVDSVEVSGDCDLNQRKGQVISIFDLVLKLKWSGFKGDLDASGTMEIPEFMHDTKPSELVIDVILNDSTKEKQEIKEVARIQLTTLLRSLFEPFTADLMTAHAKDVYITNDEMKGHPVLDTYKPKPPVDQLQQKTTSTTLGSLVTIKQTIEFHCSASDLYQTLMDPKRVQIWTRAPCTMEPEMKLFGGNISGKILKTIENEQIQMEWRLKTWPEKHVSLVTMDLKQDGDGTKLYLKQEKVPLSEKDVVEGNWMNYYWNSIKRTFGFGALL
jgi:activator of HSP90 ATPase